MKHTPRIALIVAMLLSATLRAQDAKTFKGDDFEIKVAPAMNITEPPPRDQAMQAISDGMTDSRGLQCQEGLMVQILRGENPQRRPVAEGKQEYAAMLRQKTGAAMLEGPIVENVNVPGSDGGGVLIAFRIREEGKQRWRLNLFAHRGTDIYRINGIITAYPGSELLSTKSEAFKSVRSSVLSIQLIAPTTKPAATKPAP